ncbi:hypothetical protein OSTOST_09227, partial [Ostertagia ostertagi]
MERLGQFPLCVPLLQGLRPSLPPWLPLALPSMPPSLQSVLPQPVHPATDSLSVTTATEEDVSVKSETTDEAAIGRSPAVEVTVSSTSPMQRTAGEAISRPDSAESSILSEVSRSIGHKTPSKIALVFLIGNCDPRRAMDW